MREEKPVIGIKLPRQVRGSTWPVSRTGHTVRLTMEKKTMKGMLNFLEKAGLVRMDAPEEPAEPVPAASPSIDTAAIGASATATAPPPPAATGAAAPLNLDTIYANAGIAPSMYPAERLLRLLDGLRAMDDATRLMAVRAMDAADESWSIEDPLADAAAKVQALDAHAQQLQAQLHNLQSQTQTRLQAIATRQEQVVGDIRKQIAELEALAARETSRAAADTATQQAEFKAAQDQTARELAEIAQLSQRLQGLSSQFGDGTPVAKE